MNYDVRMITDLLPCERQSPCQNGSTCTNNGHGGYTCSCTAGYHGTNCESEIDECSSNPCENGGTCLVSLIILAPCFNLIIRFIPRIALVRMTVSAPVALQVIAARPTSMTACQILAGMVAPVL